MATKNTVPAWAQRVREKYIAGEASTFVLYRNVFDSFLVGDEFVDLKGFLTGVFVEETKKTVVEVSAEFGVKCVKGAQDIVSGDDLLAQLHSLEKHLRGSSGTAVIVPYAETLMPGDGAGFVSSEDRKVSTVFHRWSLDRQLNGRNNITFIIVESLGSLNPGLLANPKVSAVDIPMPDFAARAEVVSVLQPGLTERQVALYAERMSGLRVVQIESLMRASGATAMSEAERVALIEGLLKDSPEGPERARKFAGITAGMTAEEIVKLVEPTKVRPSKDADEDVLRLIYARKRELIEKECAGLLSFVETKHGLAAVGGAEHLTGELMEIAKRMREGTTKVSPMGFLGVGAMGAGKTFVLGAFLKDAGLPAVELKGVRSKWVGSTDNNLERVLATVKAMGPIAVLIDEADRSFGNGDESESDGGTDSRMKARIKSFMSDPSNRGVVLFILLTNRPDKLDPDMKRPGRLDYKLPFFYAETAEDRSKVMAAVLGRFGAKDTVDEAGLVAICNGLDGYSNADLEALALLGLEFVERDATLPLHEALSRAKADFIPPQQGDMIRFMELLAVSETSRRSLLPARFKDMKVEEIQALLSQARLRAGA